MVGFAHARSSAGELVPGLIATANSQSVGAAIDDIALLAEFLSEDEIRDLLIVYLPFRG